MTDEEMVKPHKIIKIVRDFDVWYCTLDICNHVLCFVMEPSVEDDEIVCALCINDLLDRKRDRGQV